MSNRKWNGRSGAAEPRRPSFAEPVRSGAAEPVRPSFAEPVRSGAAERVTRRRCVCLAAALLCAATLAGVAAEPARAAQKPVRKPGLSFLFSALLPGAGQLYNGDRRGYVFLGIEAAAWFTRASYADAADRREKEYQTFAGRHWVLDRYRPPFDDAGAFAEIQERHGNWTQANDSLVVWLFANDRDEYFEQIGREDRFRGGWDDFASTFDPSRPSARSPHRDRYREMRSQRDDLESRSRIAVAGLVINRLVSSIDALRTARGRGEEARRGGGTEEGARLAEGVAYPAASESDPDAASFAARTIRLEGGFIGGDEPRVEIRLVRILP